MSKHIGVATSRVDGALKVTGAAPYIGEFTAPGLTYGVVVPAPVARGKLVHIDADEARRQPGVLEVFTHDNAPRLAWFDRSYRDQIAPTGSPLRPLQSDEIQFFGQPVALVVAETFEAARHAATLVRVVVERGEHATDLEAAKEHAFEPPHRGKMGYVPPPKPRGDADAALAAAALVVDAVYTHPIEHHNPMEPHATTVVVEIDGTLTIHDKTQSVKNSKDLVVKVFGLDAEKVRVVSPFIGGAFGSGLRPQYQLILAVLAATELRRSVRVVLTRQQMFSIGYRPVTHQRIRLGAAADGTLTAIVHRALGNTSRFENYCENVVPWSGVLYQCDNTRLEYEVVALDLMTPCDMRAPGAVTGLWALESAIDELADKAGIDPLALRLKNYAERDQEHARPFSSKELRACYAQAAERFGWHGRHATRSLRRGERLVGWGMATGVWEAQQAPSSARALLSRDGTLQVTSASADIGPGTYTIMTQIAADTLGLPLSAVRFSLGDTAMPAAVIQGGSMTAASVGSAVQAACERVRAALLKLARKAEPAFAKLRPDEVECVDGQLRATGDPSRALEIRELMRRAGVQQIVEEATAIPDAARQERYTRNAHSAVFVEVEVDEALGVVTVTRVVSAVACGRVLNPKTARSQVLGGVVWGIGMALTEESVVDHAHGRIINHSFAEYHVPVHADVPAIDVIFVDEHDDVVNPLGVKGLGEIGVVGVAAAIANAVAHATGKRVRDLPITLDKLL